MGIGTPDDLDGEVVDMGGGGCKFLTGITAICEEADQRGVCVTTALDEIWRAVAVLDVSGVDQSIEQVSGRVGRD